MADILDSRLGVTPPRLIRIDGYLIDMSKSETYTFPGEVTKYPAESGPDTSDHIRDLSPEIEIECIVSDTPSTEIAQDSSRQVDTATGETPLPSEDALAKLLDMKARRRPITVEASLGSFPSMACESIEVTRDKDTNNALFFKAKFVKFIPITNSRQRVRVKTPMAGKPAAKNAASPPFQVDDRINWRHGEPPGSFTIVALTVVLVQYNFQSPNLDANQRRAYGRNIIGNPLVRYFDATTLDHQGGFPEILGVRRRALVQDLARDGIIARNIQSRKSVDTAKAAAPPEVEPQKIGITDVIGSFGSIRGPTGGF